MCKYFHKQNKSHLIYKNSIYTDFLQIKHQSCKLQPTKLNKDTAGLHLATLTNLHKTENP